MPVNKKSVYGEIQITDNAIATLVGTAVSECYGVVGVTPPVSSRGRAFPYLFRPE